LDIHYINTKMPSSLAETAAATYSSSSSSSDIQQQQQQYQGANLI
jgi:hypothetical protein